MRKVIVRGSLALLLSAAAGVVWIFSVTAWPNIQFYRTHRKIWETTSPARLQLMARQSINLARTPSPSGKYLYYRGDIPHDLKDIDPSCVLIRPDKVRIELHGGFYDFGFIVRQTENNPNVWEIVRYDEEREVQSGTYNLENMSERADPSR